MPRVSLIIPTHHRPDLLPRAVESAKTAGRETEVIVVDDASVDGTAEVCRALQGIKYIRLEHNLGVAGARNVGLLASTSEYIAFLDDDDVRLPGSLDGQVEALAGEPDAGFIYGQAILGQQDGTPTDDFYPAHCPQGDVFWELLAQNFVPCGATVFRRSCLYRAGLLDESIPGIDDWDLWLRLAELYPVLALGQPVMIWRKSTPTSGQGTSRAVAMVKLSTIQFRQHWLRLPRAAKASAMKRRESWRRFSNNMARHLIWEAWRSLAGGRLVDAQHDLLAALYLHPAGVARVMVRPASFRFLLERLVKLRNGNSAGGFKQGWTG